LTADLTSAPGIQRVGATTHLPFSGQNLENTFTVEGFDVPPGGEGPVAGLRGVIGDYFAALGIRVKRGRAFTNTDREETAPVAIVNETFARRYWGAQDPIGRRVRLGGPDSNNPWREVVGVVGDVKHSGPAAETRPEVHVPYVQLEPGVLTTFARGLSFVVRGSGSAAELAGLVRARAREVDAAIPLNNIQTIAQLASDIVARPRFRTVLLGIFALLALMLATVGVFGVSSYFVTQRSHEIGIRIALGAQRADVVRMIVVKGIALAAAGATLGLVLAIPLSRSMTALLFQAPRYDAATFAAVASVLVAVAAIASYCPARRATRIDPAVALRME
jgi:putative ABC transport system permease protein